MGKVLKFDKEFDVCEEKSFVDGFFQIDVDVYNEDEDGELDKDTAPEREFYRFTYSDIWEAYYDEDEGDFEEGSRWKQKGKYISIWEEDFAEGLYYQLEEEYPAHFFKLISIKDPSGKEMNVKDIQKHFRLQKFAKGGEVERINTLKVPSEDAYIALCILREGYYDRINLDDPMPLEHFGHPQNIRMVEDTEGFAYIQGEEDFTHPKVQYLRKEFKIRGIKDYSFINGKAIPKSAFGKYAKGGVPYPEYEGRGRDINNVEIPAKFYQPDLDDVEREKYDLFSFEVFKSKSKAKKLFPNAKIIEYKRGDIEEPTMADDFFAKGGKVKKGNEMLIGGIAGVLLGIFFNK
jgi:hypothetical protein